MRSSSCTILAAEAILEGGAILLGIAGQERIGVWVGWLGQEVAVAIDEGDALGREPGTAAATRCRIPATCRLSSGAAPRSARTIEALGFDLLAAEQAALGLDEMDPRRTDAAQRADRAGELALDGAAQVDVAEKARWW